MKVYLEFVKKVETAVEAAATLLHESKDLNKMTFDEISLLKDDAFEVLKELQGLEAQYTMVKTPLVTTSKGYTLNWSEILKKLGVGDLNTLQGMDPSSMKRSVMGLMADVDGIFSEENWGRVLVSQAIKFYSFSPTELEKTLEVFKVFHCSVKERHAEKLAKLTKRRRGERAGVSYRIFKELWLDMVANDRGIDSMRIGSGLLKERKEFEPMLRDEGLIVFLYERGIYKFDFLDTIENYILKNAKLTLN